LIVTSKPVSELLYDSEATLRLVDSALDEIRDPEARSGAYHHLAASTGGRPIGIIGLSQLLARGYAEIVSVLGSLRQSRSVLEKQTVERLQHTHAKLKEVTTATETAATNVLDGLERALALVDELDGHTNDGDDAPRVRVSLRDELFSLMGHMQFQDITTQQLSYASAVIADMEQRLASLAAAFDPAAFGTAVQPSETPDAAPAVYDPAATTHNAEHRQAMADEIFTQKDNK
jgi:hypothetical protein